MRTARFVSDGRCITGSFDGEYLLGFDGSRFEASAVTWLPPVKPSKMIGLVLNYADHANELGLSPSKEPILLLKPVNTLIGHLGKIVYPKEATFVHYEGELAVVIGRQARRIPADRASEFIQGYTIANDVTARDFIADTFRPPVRAKGFDTFCPLGPCLVTPDEIDDFSNLNVKTAVNGELRQFGNTKNLMHPIPELVEFISSFMTLESGDVILTGTPKGISPIVPGDKVEITVDNLGTLTNFVVKEGQN